MNPGTPQQGFDTGLSGAGMSGMRMTGTDLSGVDMTGAGMDGADMSRNGYGAGSANDMSSIFGNTTVDLAAPLFTDTMPDNRNSEIRENLEKLLFCIELASWEKAESFAGKVRNLLSEAEPEVKRNALGLLLSVRKEDYDRSLDLVSKLGEGYGI